MKVVVKDKKEIYLIEGRKVAGDVVDLDERTAQRYLAQGAVERYETKVIREVPLQDAGAAEPLSVSPADRALLLKTFKEFASGEIQAHRFKDYGKTPEETAANQKKKRGRPRKAS